MPVFSKIIAGFISKNEFGSVELLEKLRKHNQLGL